MLGHHKSLRGIQLCPLPPAVNFHQGFGLDVPERGMGRRGEGEGWRAAIYKGVSDKEPFCSASCTENICSVMQAAVGFKTHCRAADKGPNHPSPLPHSVSKHKHLHLSLHKGWSCQPDPLASVVSFSPAPFQRPPRTPMSYPSCHPV